MNGGKGAEGLANGAGNDVLTGNLGNYTISDGIGSNSMSVGSGSDLIFVNSVVGYSSDSCRVATASDNKDSSQDTITGFNWGTNTIRVVTTGSTDF